MQSDSSIWLIAHNIRSAYNVGALFRLCDGLGIDLLILSGYTPYPAHSSDKRLPHIARRVHDRIHKTALGAEDTVRWVQYDTADTVINTVKRSGYELYGLEQDKLSCSLQYVVAPKKVALLIGEEVEGIKDNLKKNCALIIEIPMYGMKESYNVATAAAMALYQLRFAKTNSRHN